jgi:hypothetical protein
MTELRARVNGNCQTAAFDWFPRIADELELLEPGEPSWRSDAADRLRALLEQPARLAERDGNLLAVVALELVGEEDQAALDAGLVTWRSLAADECAELADTLRRAA